LEPTRFPIIYFTGTNTYQVECLEDTPWAKWLPYDPEIQIVFKHAEKICQLHLYIFPERLEPLHIAEFFYSQFSYLILLVDEFHFQSTDFTHDFEKWAFKHYLVSRKLFFWTTDLEHAWPSNGSVSVQRIVFRNTYYICQFCHFRPEFWPYRLITGEGELRAQMNLITQKMRKHIVWNPHKYTEKVYCTAEPSKSNLHIEVPQGAAFRKRLAKLNRNDIPLLFVPFIKNILYTKNLTKSAQFKKLRLHHIFQYFVTEISPAINPILEQNYSALIRIWTVLISLQDIRKMSRFGKLEEFF